MNSQRERDKIAEKQRILAPCRPASKKRILERWTQEEADQRLIAECFLFWRLCANRLCRRDRACRGEPDVCNELRLRMDYHARTACLEGLKEAVKKGLTKREAGRVILNAMRARRGATRAPATPRAAPAKAV